MRIARGWSIPFAVQMSLESCWPPVGRGAWRAALVSTLCVAALLAWPGTPAARAADPGTARAFLVADHKSGHILAASHAEDKLQVASLTKIATAVVLLDWVRLGGHTLDETATVGPAALADADVNPVGFQAGDQVTLRDLLYAALLQSDNIAANTIADFVGRDLPGDPNLTPQARFVLQMNLFARKCKADRTRFLNPTGRDGKERPYSTALDMARITRKALDKADFNFFIAQKEHRISLNRGGAKSDYLLRNTNELLGTNNVDGGKTGHSDRAGECLMVTSVRPPIVWQEGTVTYKTTRRLVIIVLGSPDRFHEAAGLIDQGTNLYDQWMAAGHHMEETSL